jgi:hypothetical protein
VSSVVVAALDLVKGLLASGLVLIGLDTTSNAVCGIGDGLLDLLLGRLGGVRSQLLLGLGREILATEIRHLDRLIGGSCLVDLKKVVLKKYV